MNQIKEFLKECERQEVNMASDSARELDKIIKNVRSAYNGYTEMDMQLRRAYKIAVDALRNDDGEYTAMFEQAEGLLDELLDKLDSMERNMKALYNIV